MGNGMTIRTATPADAQALLAIYAPFVRETAITFEAADEVPAVEEFRARIEEMLRDYPWLVAELDGEVCGYAYAHRFRERAAYDWAVEPSIYVAPHAQGAGVGRALYAELERLLALQGVRTLIACITCVDRADDPYLTDASIRFHAQVGYRMAGRIEQCGFKLGRWYDICWMQKEIGGHPEDMPPIIPFSQMMR